MSQWAYEIIEPLVDKTVVSDPRRNKLLEEGSKSDEIDARKLADLLWTGMLKADITDAAAGCGQGDDRFITRETNSLEQTRPRHVASLHALRRAQ